MRLTRETWVPMPESRSNVKEKIFITTDGKGANRTIFQERSVFRKRRTDVLVPFPGARGRWR